MAQIAVDFLLAGNWISRGIGWFGASDWSHCASVIVGVNPDGTRRERYLDSRDNVIAGVPPGVQIREIKTEPWIKKRRATLEVSLADYTEWEKNLRAKITDEYDKNAIRGFLEGESIHTAGRYICSAAAVNSIQHVGRGWISSALAMNGMQHIGYVPFPLVKPAHRISPGELLLILQTTGFTIGPVIVP